MESDNGNKMELGEAIERILMESNLSLSAFSRKTGYSRQYIYDLLKTRDQVTARKVQLDTLKQICDATGYSLRRLLTDIGYLPPESGGIAPNSIIVVKNNCFRSTYSLEENDFLLISELVKSLKGKK